MEVSCQEGGYVQGQQLVGPTAGGEGGVGGGGRWGGGVGLGGFWEHAGWGCLELVVVYLAGGGGGACGWWGWVRWFEGFGGLCAVEEYVGVVSEAAERVHCEW